MPEILKEFPKARRAGRTPVHPYNDWFQAATKNPNGIKLVRGEDFDSDIKTMRHNIYRTSNDRGLKVETVTINDGDEEALGLRVIKPDDKKADSSKKNN